MSSAPLPGRAPAAPSMDARSLVHWIGDKHGAMLDQPGADVAGTVAMRLAVAGRNAGAIRAARRKLGFGVAFDTECWRNQCRPDHRLRAPSFSEHGYDVRTVFGVDRLDIDVAMTEAEVEEYAQAHLAAQIAFDPTIFQAPGHVVLTTAGLANQIALTEATLDLVDARALREPADGDAHGLPRQVFATICARPGWLDDERIAQLVDRYVRLPVDGFWVWAVGFGPGAREAEMMLRLVLALQENSGLPAVPGGLKHLWQAALVRGVAAAVTGPDRGALDYDPYEAPPAPDPDGDDDDNARRLHSYHGAVLGSFRFDERGEAAELATYRRNPCPCGHHEPAVPPRGRRQVAAHNQWWRIAEARIACVGSAAVATAALAERLNAVNVERLAVGLGRPPAGWRRALEPFAGLPVGWGAADGRA